MRTCPVCQSKQENEKPFCMECGWEFKIWLGDISKKERLLYEERLTIFKRNWERLTGPGARKGMGNNTTSAGSNTAQYNETTPIPELERDSFETHDEFRERIEQHKPVCMGTAQFSHKSYDIESSTFSFTLSIKDWAQKLYRSNEHFYITAKRDDARSIFESGSSHSVYGKLHVNKNEVLLKYFEVYALDQTWPFEIKMEIIDPILKAKFVYIPPGTFMMGSPSDEPGRDSGEVLHEVKLTHGFYIQSTQVTQGQWHSIMGNNPSFFSSAGNNCPVERVSWDDAQEYIKKLNQKNECVYRLPIEAEWEYAARARSTTAIYTGHMEIIGKNNAPALDNIAWYSGNSGVDYSGGIDSSGWPEKQYASSTSGTHIQDLSQLIDTKPEKQYASSTSGTHPVAQKQPNAWGLYDMLGNVWEWCQDWYDDYPSGSVINPEGPSTGSLRVIRGGGWGYDAEDCRSANRSRYVPDYRLLILGFRLVLSPGQQDGNQQVR